ncbi:MAG: hypothetical protein EWM73_02512 [Nitrospira sp.]|nr:MAG: hypothetical protein EWM73_02512 [Nitrospira sp.]
MAWMVKTGGMLANRAFLSIETHSWRRPVTDWCVGLENIDYRFWKLGLCMLAVPLLYALG